MKTIKGFKTSTLFKMAMIIMLLSPLLQAEMRYNLITLERSSNDYTFYAYSINNNGEIVGYVMSRSGASYALSFDPTGHQRSIELGGLPNYPYSRAYSGNNYGQVVGYSFDSERHTRASLFDDSGRWYNIDLGTLGGASSVAVSVNDNGLIVGYAQDRSGTEHAALFDETGRGYNVDLGTLPGCANSYATSVNNNGQIVGYCIDESNQFYGVLFDISGRGRNINLGTLGGLLSTPTNNNDNGQIVGVSGVAPSTQHAVLFKLPGGSENNIDLGALPVKFGNSEALSINDNGQIVGYCINDEGDARATFFDTSGQGGNIDLNTLIDPLSGWTLNYAYSTNDNGLIVGRGSKGAFLLVPVEVLPGLPAGTMPSDGY